MLPALRRFPAAACSMMALIPRAPRAARRRHQAPQEALEKLLGATCKAFTTKCVSLELKGLGDDYRDSFQTAKRQQLHKCGHEQPISAADCILQQIGARWERPGARAPARRTGLKAVAARRAELSALVNGACSPPSAAAAAQPRPLVAAAGKGNGDHWWVATQDSVLRQALAKVGTMHRAGCSAAPPCGCAAGIRPTPTPTHPTTRTPCPLRCCSCPACRASPPRCTACTWTRPQSRSRRGSSRCEAAGTPWLAAGGCACSAPARYLVQACGPPLPLPGPWSRGGLR